jgi:hypothetical protein
MPRKIHKKYRLALKVTLIVGITLVKSKIFYTMEIALVGQR